MQCPKIFAMRRNLSVRLSAAAALLLSTVVAAEGLRLQQAVARTLANDPWLAAQVHRQEQHNAAALAAAQWPDPTLSFGLVNLAADTLDFNQEPMTQLRVGLNQRVPRGDTPALKKQRIELNRLHIDALADLRVNGLRAEVAGVWLSLWQAEQSMLLIARERPLFEQLVDVVQAGYGAAMRGTSQQDLLRAQLELTRLDDRLIQLRAERDAHWQRLQTLMRNGADDRALPTPDETAALTAGPAHLPGPDAAQLRRWQENPAAFRQRALQHPSLQALAQRVAMAEAEVALAREQRKPQWTLNAGYGYRDDAPGRIERSDFLSLGFSVDLPLWPEKRQDAGVRAALAGAEAVRSEHAAQLKAMHSEFVELTARLQRQQQRAALHRHTLLPQLQQHAEAALHAYSNESAQFAEAVRARIAEVNARIDALMIDTECLKLQVQINRLLDWPSNAEIQENTP